MNMPANPRWPLVSAVVLCYNQARFVVECLEGIKAQQYPNLELILNDLATAYLTVADYLDERLDGVGPS